MQSKNWIVWNLFLACAPVVLAYLMAGGAQRYTLQRKRIPWIAWLPVAIIWFAFLPNSCYLFTEWRHFLFDAPFTGPRTAGATGDSLIHAAKQGLLFLVYSAAGMLSFSLSIRPVHRLLAKAGVRTIWLAAPFFFMVSLGVYLGLVLRLNSWELFTKPLSIVIEAASALESVRLAKIIAIFAGMLWLLYITVDIWVDGFSHRVQQFKKT